MQLYMTYTEIIPRYKTGLRKKIFTDNSLTFRTPIKSLLKINEVAFGNMTICEVSSALKDFL
jgi:hypothetical protein